jgi:hypothetical protein
MQDRPIPTVSTKGHRCERGRQTQARRGEVTTDDGVGHSRTHAPHKQHRHTSSEDNSDGREKIGRKHANPRASSAPKQHLRHASRTQANDASRACRAKGKEHQSSLESTRSQQARKSPPKVRQSAHLASGRTTQLPKVRLGEASR